MPGEPAATGVLIRGAELPDGVADLRLAGARIAEIAPELAPNPGEAIFEARGGALLPGLHDHHIHLLALAATEDSLDCSPGAVADEAALAALLRDADRRGGDGWLRGTGYHESVAGPLDRHRLDAWVPSRPLRIQHRSGALWVINSAGLAALRSREDDEPWPTAFAREAGGTPDGRVYRADAWLRRRWGGAPPTLGPLGERLAAFGVTGVTDASADNDAESLALLLDASRTRALPQRLWMLGRPELPAAPVDSRVTRGAVKWLLDEARLPTPEDFAAGVAAAHAAGRALAVHCATRTELVFALAGFRAAGAREGDRVEHGSVAPPELVEQVAELGLRVVSQPHFIAERGDHYLRDVEAGDRPWLYRGRAWLDAGVRLAAGSDAPYGSPDPWAAMRAAVERTSASGARLDPAEALSPEAALALFASAPDDPGGPPRRIAVGEAADLCLLDRPWRAARQRLRAEDVAATWCAGRPVYPRRTDSAGAETGS